MMFCLKLTHLTVAILQLLMLLSLALQAHEIAVKRFHAQFAHQSISTRPRIDHHVRKKGSYGRGSSIHLSRSPGDFWHVTVQVDHQKMNVMLDTGSDTLVINPTSYRRGPSAIDLHRNATVDYGYGSTGLELQVHLYQDEVKLGPLSGSKVPLEHIVGPRDGHLGGQDGLIGLSAKTYDAKAEADVLAALRKDCPDWEGVFTLDLHQHGGKMGFERPVAGRHHHGDLVWSSIANSSSSWDIDGKVAGIHFRANVDSANFGIFMPVVRFNKIVSRYSHLTVHVDHSDGSHYMVGKCDWAPKDLPFTFFGSDGKTIELLMTPAIFWFMGPPENRPGYCLGALVGKEGADPTQSWAFGGPLFLMAYLAFDVENQRLGVGHKLHQHRQGRLLF